MGMPQQGLFSSTPGIQFFSPEELSTLPLVDPTTVVGIQSVGYDPNNPARLVRVNAAASDTSGNSTTALAAAIAAADAADIAATAALVEREGLRFDGTAGAVIGGGGIPAVGTGDFTVIFSIGPFTPATLPILWPTQVNAFGIVLLSDSTAQVSKAGVANLASSAALTATGFNVVAYTRAGTVGTYYANGQSIGVITDSNSYTGPTDQFGILSSTFLNARVCGLRHFNYALTQSEIAALTRRGLVTLPEQRGGSMVALNTSAFVNGCNGSSPLTSFTGASSTGFTAVNSSGGFQGATSPNVITVKVGQKYRVNCTVTYTSGELPSVVLTNATTWAGYSNTVALTAGVNSMVLTANVNGTALLGFLTNTSASYAISAVSVIPLGTLFEQDSGQRNAGYMVGDTSGNKLDLILPASGVSIIDPAMRGTIRFTTTTSGNQQIGGTQVIIPTNARITSWVINSSGTPNVTLGNVSAGAQYRASAAVVSGDNEITLLTRFTTTGNLWVNSSTTATLKHTIQWEYIQ